MDIRLRKVLAGVSTAAIALTQFGTVLAAYGDVPSGAWFKESVDAFVEAGYLDESQARFRPGDLATRAEFTKLIVELNGGVLSTPPAVPSFSDVGTSAWFYGYMEEAAKEGWVRGDNNCYGSKPCAARPNANINRAEAAALIVRAFALESTEDAPQFVDNPSGQWYTDSIQSAADHCVLQGDDDTKRVRPGDNMNRAEMVVMLHRVDQDMTFGVDCGVETGTEPMITDAASTSGMKVEVEFNVDLDPDAAEDVSHYSITNSGEVAVESVSMVNDSTVEVTTKEGLVAGEEYTVSVTDMATADGREFSDTATFKGFDARPKTDATLEVSVSSKNPVGDTVPRGSNGVVMLSLDVTASCDDSVSVETITMLHEGFGDESDITGVYASVDGARVSRKRTIDDQDQTADLRLSPAVMVAACKTETIDIVADFLTTATISGEHNFVVELPSDVVSNAQSVTGNFPMRGNTFKVGAVTSGQLSIAYRTVSPDEVEVGDRAVVVGKFELSTDSVEDQTIYSMTIEQNSTVSDGDITNLKVRRTDGTVLTNTVAQFSGDFATFVFDPPFTILEGDKITLEIVADVVGGAGDSVILHFEETSDIFSVGSLYGYGVNGQLYGSQIALPAETSTLPDTVTIDAGEFTIEIDGPSQQSYTRDSDDVVLANVEMQTGGETVDLRDLFVAIEGETSTGGTLCGSGSAGSAGTSTGCATGTDDTIQEILEDVEIRNNRTGQTISAVRLTGSGDSGSAESGTSSATNTGTFQVYRFDDFTVNGSEVFQFRVDFKDNGSSKHPKDGDQFRIHICGEPTRVSTGDNTVGCTFGGLISISETYQMDIEGISTGDKVQDVRPRGTVTGNFQRISAAGLTVAVKSIGVRDTAVKNTKNLLLYRFEARANEAEDILLTKVAVEAASGSLQNAQNYTLWVDSDGDAKVDTILQKGVASQSSAATFNDMVGGGFVIPKEQTVLFEVHGDVSASLVTPTSTVSQVLQIRFATGGTAAAAVSNSYIEAEEVDDGSSLSGIKTNTTLPTGVTSADITVTMVPSQVYLLVSQGDLFVTIDSTPLRNRQCLGGALCDAILRVQFHSENEDIEVTDLQINSSGSTADFIDRIELYKEGATTFFAVATIGGCGSDDVLTTNTSGGVSNYGTSAFCANMDSKQLIVPEDADVDILMRPRLKNDESGTFSNQVLALFITQHAVSNNSTGSGAVRARGAESTNLLNANDGNATADGEVFIGRSSAAVQNLKIVGSRNLTVLSKITSITNANPDANGTSVPTGVSDIGQFKIAAASHTNTKNGTNDVTLSGVVFNVIATNVKIDATTFKLYNKANSTITKTCDVYRDDSTRALITAGGASGALVVDCRNLQASGNPNVEIDAGQDQTFILQGNITNAQVSSTATSTLQVSLQNFDSITRLAYGINATADSHFEWVDKDTGTASTNGTTTHSRFKWLEYPETTVKSTSYQS